MTTIGAHTIFTNCALTDDGDVWWEGMTEEPPAHLIDWHGNDWTPGLRRARRPPQRALHRRRPRRTRRSRPSGRTRPACRSTRSSSAAAARAWCRWSPRRSTGSTASSSARHGLRDDRRGGRRGRRAAPRPVRDAAVLRLQHGRLLRPLAEDRRAERTPRKLPKIFYVNWFRKDADGRFLWPGFGENIRVLEWVFAPLRRRRLRRWRRRSARSRPVGGEGIDVSGLDVAGERHAAAAATSTSRTGSPSCPQFHEHLAKFDRLPHELHEQLKALEQRLAGS